MYVITYNESQNRSVTYRKKYSYAIKFAEALILVIGKYAFLDYQKTQKIFSRT